MDYVCKKCGVTGARKDIPYKIIWSPDDITKFKGMLCEKCFNQIFDNTPKIEEIKKEEN